MNPRVECYRGNCTGKIFYHEKTGKFSCNTCQRIYTEKEVRYLSGITLRMLKPVTLK
jgi:hypothetical protein